MELRSRRERPLATLVDKIVLWNFDLKDAMHILSGNKYLYANIVCIGIFAMKENLEGAIEELKRADHLIFVSLKYTRTVDVIKSVIERIQNAFSFAIDAMLKYYHIKQKISVPTNPVQKVEVLKKINTDKRFHEFLDFYLMLRKILRSEYTKIKEYRRHVAMIVKLEGRTEEINIDKIYEFYDMAKEFYSTAEKIVYERSE